MEEPAHQILASFLSQEENPGLDDHPEVTLNPVMLHCVHRAEIETRERLREEALLARQIREGASDEDVARWREEAAEEVGVGSVFSWRPRRWGTATNSSRILVNAGAKFRPLDDARGDEAQAAVELRLKTRNVNAHLERQGFDTKCIKEPETTGRGLRVTALTKAKETAYKPVDGEAAQRAEERRAFAQRGRWRVAPPVLTPRSDWMTTVQRLREARAKKKRPMALWGTAARRAGGYFGAGISVQTGRFTDLTGGNVRSSVSDMFGMIDKQSSGTIGITELESMMRELGQDPTRRELEEMMSQIDQSHTGRIQVAQFQEFIDQEKEAEVARRERLSRFDELEC